jgi:hypothetical protein
VRVTAALLARYAEVEPDTGMFNIIGGGVDGFGVPTLPIEFPMPFALQLRFAESEAGTPREITLLTRDPQLREVGEPTTFEITPTLGEDHAEGWEGIFSVAGAVTLYVEEPGTHSIGIQIDGAESGDIPFQVVLTGD